MLLDESPLTAAPGHQLAPILAVAQGGARLIQGEEEDVVRLDELLAGHQTPAQFQQPITQQGERHADG